MSYEWPQWHVHAFKRAVTFGLPCYFRIIILLVVIPIKKSEICRPNLYFILDAILITVQLFSYTLHLIFVCNFLLFNYIYGASGTCFISVGPHFTGPPYGPIYHGFLKI